MASTRTVSPVWPVLPPPQAASSRSRLTIAWTMARPSDQDVRGDRHLAGRSRRRGGECPIVHLADRGAMALVIGAQRRDRLVVGAGISQPSSHAEERLLVQRLH